jgi:hypothetical protein
MTDRPSDWLTDWLADRPTDRPTNWLTEQINQLTSFTVHIGSAAGSYSDGQEVQ